METHRSYVVIFGVGTNDLNKRWADAAELPGDLFHLAWRVRRASGTFFPSASLGMRAFAGDNADFPEKVEHFNTCLCNVYALALQKPGLTWRM